MSLSDFKCRTAKPREKQYRLSDGDTLYLEVRPNGGRYWRMRCRFDGKEKMLALGVYPEVSLLEARQKRDTIKRRLAKGLDPSLEEKAPGIGRTFEAVAREWHNRWQTGKSTEYAIQKLRRLEMDIFPALGRVPIGAITTPQLLMALTAMEGRGIRETVHRVCATCAEVFTYGIGKADCENNPAMAAKGLLLAKVRGHFPAITDKELPVFLQKLRCNEARLYSQTRLAIEALLLTFVRPGVLRFGTWDEIDWNALRWEIPATRMKTRLAHIVPLSHQAIMVFRRLQELAAGSKWMVPSPNKPRQPISESCVGTALARMGYHGEMCAHGFRALARTTIRERRIETDTRVIELQLAHTIGPYDRTQLLEERAAMMQRWADYLDEAALHTAALPLTASGLNARL
jgi:integrase